MLKKIHLKNGETLKDKRGFYTMKDTERVSSGKVKYDFLTGKSAFASSIRRFGPYMNRILGMNNDNYIDTLLWKKYFHLKLRNYQPWTTYSMASHVTYYILGTLIKAYYLVYFEPKYIQYKKLVNGVIDRLKIIKYHGLTEMEMKY